MIINVVVTGVCGLIRVGPNDLRVLAAADGVPIASGAPSHTQGAASAHAGHGHHCIPRHRPFVRVQQGQAGLILVSRTTFTAPGLGGSPVDHVIFRDVVLTLRRVAPAPPPTLDEVTINPSRIVEMARVAPQHARPNPALLANSYDPISTRVSAVLRVPTGGVSFHRGSPRDVFKFEPRLGADPYIEAFAREVIIRMTLPGTEWVLESRGFASSAPAEPVARFTGEANTFEVTFGNGPTDDLLALDPEAQEEVDHHFALLYRLLADPPAVESLPIRVSARSNDAMLGGTNCPPVIVG